MTIIYIFEILIYQSIYHFVSKNPKSSSGSVQENPVCSIDRIVDDADLFLTLNVTSGNFFFRKSAIGTTVAAIEANNGKFCPPKRIEKFPLILL